MPVLLYYRKNPVIKASRIVECLENLLSFLKMKSAILEVSLVGSNAIKTFNRKFRRKDRVTDVLSFPLDPIPRSKNFPWHLGEIVIAVPVARKQSLQAGRSLMQQLTRLAVHGLVHLRGKDHETGTAERRSFEREERRCLQYLKRKGLNPWDGYLQF